ncbi:MAG: hypothetical protein F4213_03475 [Boseongicola sp. SB0677_bin_26]|nr:hypothetical protein [Boseongicola sp. SB0677_bin_26]
MNVTGTNANTTPSPENIPGTSLHATVRLPGIMPTLQKGRFGPDMQPVKRSRPWSPSAARNLVPRARERPRRCAKRELARRRPEAKAP